MNMYKVTPKRKFKYVNELDPFELEACSLDDARDVLRWGYSSNYTYCVEYIREESRK